MFKTKKPIKGSNNPDMQIEGLQVQGTGRERPTETWNVVGKA